MMYSVVVSVSNIHPDGLEVHPITLLASLDGDGTGYHGVPGAAHRAVAISNTAAGGAVVETWGKREGGGEKKK